MSLTAPDLQLATGASIELLDLAFSVSNLQANVHFIFQIFWDFVFFDLENRNSLLQKLKDKENK